jgi:hypothetical protein
MKRHWNISKDAVTVLLVWLVVLALLFLVILKIKLFFHL